MEGKDEKDANIKWNAQLFFFSENISGLESDLIPDELPEGHRIRSEGLLKRSERIIYDDVSIEDP